MADSQKDTSLPSIRSFAGSVLVNGARSSYEFLHWWGAIVSALAFAGVVVSVSVAALPLWLGILVAAVIFAVFQLKGAHTTTIDALRGARMEIQSAQADLKHVTVELNAGVSPTDLSLGIPGVLIGERNSEAVMQLTVRATNRGESGLVIHDWAATLEYVGTVHELRHEIGQERISGSLDLPFADRVGPLTPGQSVLLLQFVVPGTTKDAVVAAIDSPGAGPVMLSLTVTGAQDQTWGNAVDLGALSGDRRTEVQIS
jgi:hypothetical protein